VEEVFKINDYDETEYRNESNQILQHLLINR
jgi:hypothetical protein